MWVIRHTSEAIPDLPPLYWSGDDELGHWSLEPDVARARRFPTAAAAERAYRGDYRMAASCCQPYDLRTPPP